MLQDLPFTSYAAFNKENSPPSNLSKDEFESLQIEKWEQPCYSKGRQG